MSKKVVSTVLSLIVFCGISLGAQTKARDSSRPDRSRTMRSSALKTLKQIVAAQEIFKTTGGRSGYGTVQDLASVGLVEFVDPRYPIRNGYLFASVRTETAHFMVIALPIDFLETGESRQTAWLGTQEGVVSVSAKDWRKDVAGVEFAEEEATILNLVRTLATAEAVYQSTTGRGASFGSLEQLFKEGTIDDRLGRGAKNGYQFAVVLSSNAAQFEIFATPVEYGATGLKSYYCSNEYVIHTADKKGARAAASDPILP